MGQLSPTLAAPFVSTANALNSLMVHSVDPFASVGAASIRVPDTRVGPLDVPFTSVEHPIPESLGNDDWTLPRGFVCDRRNNYFGSKVENRVINEPPFGSMPTPNSYNCRVTSGIPAYKAAPGLTLVSSRHADTTFVFAEGKYLDHYRRRLTGRPFMFSSNGPNTFFLSRFLLKVGLEVLLTTEQDPYSASF